MYHIAKNEDLAIAVIEAIQTGNVAELGRLLVEKPGLAKVRIDDQNVSVAMSRTLLHVATDWPGHYRNGAAIVSLLIKAGADVNARFSGAHTETPLHWAASCNDVEVLEALLDAGADIEAPGSVIAGGSPLDDAVAFGQWQAARRLVERGAQTKLWHASALGLMDRVQQFFIEHTVALDEITQAFWLACHGGQLEAAEYLLVQGADLNWVGYDRRTPLDAARRSGADDLVEWLLAKGARSETG